MVVDDQEGLNEGEEEKWRRGRVLLVSDSKSSVQNLWIKNFDIITYSLFLNWTGS